MKAKTKPSAATPRTFVDVHPNVILVHAGDPTAAEMKFVTLGHSNPSAMAVIIIAGLLAKNRKIKIRRFDAAGNLRR